jgi:uncharacterized membrane protein YecN with MAPEG domain
MTTLLPLSMFYISLLSSLVLFLTFNVVKERMKTHIALGAGENESMERQMRVHANLLENLLPFSLLFILSELNGSSILMLHTIGSIFLIARLFHAYGLSRKTGRSFGRYYGTLFSWICLAILIVMNLYNSVLKLFF